MDDFLQGHPDPAPGAPQPHVLRALPALRRPAGGLPGERCALLAGGPEVQGDVTRLAPTPYMIGLNKSDVYQMRKQVEASYRHPLDGKCSAARTDGMKLL